MSTFDRLNIAIVTTLALTAIAGVDCGGASSDCFRYSDCAAGLTCAAGKCVAPQLSTPGNDGSAEQSDAGTAESTLPDGDDVEAASNADGGGDAPAE